MIILVRPVWRRASWLGDLPDMRHYSSTLIAYAGILPGSQWDEPDMSRICHWFIGADNPDFAALWGADTLREVWRWLNTILVEATP